ncbi:MAG: DUF2298 domain-containing protein [Cyanobacteriota bacterium]
MENSKTLKIWQFICRHKYIILVACILVLAAILRYSGYNWDHLYSLHPDERALDQAGNRIDFMELNLDPGLYAYGSLPIYLACIVNFICAKLLPHFMLLQNYLVIGRLISATAGVLTVLFVYLIGNKLYNKETGLISSFLLAIAVIHIQNSHFATVDILLTFFITATIYYLIDIYYSKCSLKTYLIVSILIGLALAVKASAAPLVIMFFICHVINLRRTKKALKLKPYLFFGLCGVIALIINFISQPYAYLNMQQYLNSVIEQINMQKHANSCFLQQYVGTPFLIYYFKELTLRCLGLPLGIFSIISFFIAIFYSIIHPVKSKHVILLLWALPYFITINTFESKFLRYMLPLIPFYCLFTGYYFLALLGYLKTININKFFRYTLTTLFLGYTLFYALAFFSIYMKPHTFIESSMWFYKNIPANSVILSQHWEEGFPQHIRSIDRKEYEIVALELYEHFQCETEDDRKSEYLAKHLENGEYIVAPTRRLYGATYNVKERYPITTKYFDLLFTNRLGFKLIKDFYSYPSILGIEFNDDTSDESFSVYDHPKVLIFKKVESYSKEEYKQMLEEEGELSLTKDQALSIHKKEAEKEITYSIVDEIAIIIIWIVLLELLSIVGFVISHIIFKNNNGSIIFFSHLLGILVLCYTTWILASLHFIKYNFFFILIIFLILLSLSFYYLYINKNSVLVWAKNNIDTIALSKLALISCFLIFLIFRTLSPEIFSGEKPMDFGIFNNLIIIDHLPPDEIWFSGNKLNYYYFGYFMFATLAKLTFIPGFFAYNLALGTIAGLTFCASCGVLYLLTRSYYYSLLAGIFTVFLGNISAIRLLMEKPIDYHLFWATTRVIPKTINEYPLWSFIFGDLHGHVCVMPIFIFLIYVGVFAFLRIVNKETITLPVILLTGFILGTISITNSWDFPGASATLFVCFTLALILTTKEYKPSKNLHYLLKQYSLLFCIGFSSFIWFLPYWLSTKKVSVIGFGRVYENEAVMIQDFVFVWGLFLFIFVSLFLFEIFKETRKKLHKNYSYNISSLFSWIFITFLILLLCLLIMHSNFSSLIFSSYFEVLTSSLNNPILEFNRYLLMISDYFGAYTTIIFNAVLIILAIATFIILKEKIIKLICGLITFGLIITFFTETFFIYDHMNTIFKFFLEVWYIFAICATYTLYYIFKPYYYAFRASANIYIESLKLIWFIPAAVLLSLACFTSIAAVVGFSFTDKTNGYKPVKTINGLAYLKYSNPSEYQAVQWINKNIKDKNCVILEATGISYSDYTRIVTNTGIPTVAGWTHHLTQRAVERDDIKRRVEDIETIYSTEDTEKAYNLLNKYRINYVYIGQLELKDYGLKGINKFKNNPDKFKLIYSNKQVKFYEVL